MPLLALGSLTVSTPGTKVGVASIIPAAVWTDTDGRPFKGYGIQFQAGANNAGSVTVYQLQSGSYVPIAVLAAPTSNFIPSFSAALTIAPNAITMTDLYLDAENGGEGALVTLLVS